MNWTPIQEKWLMDHKGKYSFKRCAEKLGFTQKAVEHKYYGLLKKRKDNAAQEQAQNHIKELSEKLKSAIREKDNAQAYADECQLRQREAESKLQQREMVISKQQDQIAELQLDVSGLVQENVQLNASVNKYKPVFLGLYRKAKND